MINIINITVCYIWSLPGASVVKNLPANAGDLSSIPWLGRFPGEGSGKPLHLLGECHGQKSLVSYSP